METVKIYSDRIAISKWNSNLKIWEEVDIKESDRPIVFYSTCEVEIDDKVTAGDFLKLLGEHAKVIDLCYLGSTRGFELHHYLDNLKEEGDPTDLDFIEMYWGVDLYDGELSFYPGMHGIKEGDSMTWGLDFMSVNQWQHCRLRLDEKVSIVDFDSKRKKKFITRFKGKMGWTFHDLISGFLHELTWYGTPVNQKEQADKLESQGKEIEEAKKEGRLDEITVPLEQVMLEMSEEELKEAIENEDYEAAEKIEEAIRDLKETLNEKGK